MAAAHPSAASLVPPSSLVPWRRLLVRDPRASPSQLRGQPRCRTTPPTLTTPRDVPPPSLHRAGILSTGAPRAEISGCARFEDAANGLVLALRFGPLTTESAAGEASLQRSDALCGVVCRTRDGWSGAAPLDPAALPRLKADCGSGLTGKALRSLSLTSSKAGAALEGWGYLEGSVPLAACRGNWLSHLDWDGERVWTLAEEERGEWAPEEDPLPSDCRFRRDLAALRGAEADMGAAQMAKELLETLQRQDAKLRKAGRAKA